jgi:hypothetical protein
MRRRDLLAAGYSLVVLADRLPAQTPGQKDWERIAPKKPRKGVVAHEPHMATVDLECDLLVAGGGLAGVCASIAAARHGAKVVLVQDRSRLGGNSSSEVKMHVVGANCHKGRAGWREGGLIEEFRLEDAARNPHRCFELWDLMLYDKVASEPNITLLLETTLYSARKKGDRITTVLARCDKSETLYRISARLFCDSTGDSRLALEAGAEMRSGREARSEFNESLAPEGADEQTLGSSILFTSRQYEKPMPFVPPKWARKVTKEHLRMRRFSSWEYGYWWIEWGGHLDTIRDNEQIRHELLSIVMGVWDYIKNSDEYPSAANWALDWVGMMPGKRGSRRIVGDVMLTEHDLLTVREWEDAVAIGGWPLDDHPPGGFDRADLPPNIVKRPPEVYSIPLRALYSKNISNLFMAGRNISCTHAAFTSTRVMATCAVIGQAVGTAAAACLDHGLVPRQLYQQKPRLEELQQALLRDDQTIRKLANADPKDLARQARITASGETAEGPARNVVDGFVRKISNTETHCWAADPSEGGAWLELAWDKPQRLSEVQLTFDSGFHRELTLSASNNTTAGMVRGPQPETIRDYEVRVRKPGSQKWIAVAKVAGNYQRRNQHRFAPVEAEAVRIHATAANGVRQLRIFEVRCYS